MIGLDADLGVVDRAWQVGEWNLGEVESEPYTYVRRAGTGNFPIRK